MVTNLPSLFGAIAGDVFAAAQLPGGNTVGWALNEVLRRVLSARHEQASRMLIEEVRLGKRNLTDHETEESISILYRYLRAAKEGTAQLNLRLMARVIAGQFSQRSLVADEFLRHADILATLTREEIIMLGTVCRNLTAPGTRPEDKAARVFASTGPILIPAVFPTGEDFVATASALIRTGYLVPHPAVGGSNNFEVSSALERLNRLARLDQLTIDSAPK